MIANAIGLTADSFESIYVTGGAEVAEVYGGLNYADPIFYKTQTMTGSAPLVFDAYPGSLKSYTISGNTVQNGTPTPQAPVEVLGCGDKTGNLAYSRINDANISQNGMIARLDNYDIAIGRVESGKVYTANTYVYAFYTDEPTMIGDVSYDGSRIVGTAGEPSTFTAPITGYVAFRIGSGEQAMLNAGSTAIPYEQYGYKIPITCGGETNNIYLGQVETTRRIKKLVLTGEEEFVKADLSGNNAFLAYILETTAGRTDIICTHYETDNTDRNGTVYIRTPLYGRVCFIDNSFQNETDFKTYIAAQYAAGTPVTVWYVLATPETGIVYEPLHKIGDYADTITMAQAGKAISTIAGSNTLSVGTTVQPSSVSITGHIKPTTP